METYSELNMWVLFFYCYCFGFLSYSVWIIQFPGLEKTIFGEESNEFTNELGKYTNLKYFYNLMII